MVFTCLHVSLVMNIKSYYDETLHQISKDKLLLSVLIVLDKYIECGCDFSAVVDSAEVQWAGNITDKPRGPDLGQAILIGEMCCVVLAQG